MHATYSREERLGTASGGWAPLHVYELRFGRRRPVVLELSESYLFKMGPSNTGICVDKANLLQILHTHQNSPALPTCTPYPALNLEKTF